MNYNFKEIEKKWQEKWRNENSFSCDVKSDKQKKYIVPMFPYPSGKMHMGHVRNYTISDAIARYWRNKGYNVCHPIGWDSFGMPAEQAAITNGVHPKEWTDKNIQNMKEEMMSMGMSFDWSKEVSTCEVEYWKNEQRFFVDMWNAGYIERKSGIVNWDPVDMSVIANEQVIDGRGWRSGAIIEKKEMVQYYFKTTMFADDMYESIKEVEGIWPEVITKQQKQFIKNGVQRGDVIIPFSDWCISRQRYWGTPIPMIHCEICGTIPDERIPIIPPYDVKFDGKGNPIDNHDTWKYCNCPKCGGESIRETDTMDTFVQSSWYFIRYISDFVDVFEYDDIKKWFPIDYYIGGAEHAIAHMIYSRFFWRIFKKMGYIPQECPTEPFKKVITQGMVKKDGKKMSKSAGNGVSPVEMIEKWGADVCRMYIMFAAPPEQDMDWSDQNIIGCFRFINKFWNGQFRNVEHIPNKKIEEESIKKIKMMKEKIVSVYEKNYRFNTIVAAAMEVYNYISKQTNPEIYRMGYEVIIEGISPICPHICEEIKEKIFGGMVK
jgi:leucyl-tRNA synthetase